MVLCGEYKVERGEDVFDSSSRSHCGHDNDPRHEWVTDLFRLIDGALNQSLRPDGIYPVRKSAAQAW